MFLPDDGAVLLDGLTKKRDDIPPTVLARVRAMQQELRSAARKGR